MPVRNLDILAHWARVLQIPLHLLWFKLPPDRSVNVARRAAVRDECRFPPGRHTLPGLPSTGWEGAALLVAD